MKKKTPDKNEPAGEAGTRFGGILSGLTGLVEKLNELAETGAELRRGGELHGAGQERKGIYGFTVKVGLGDQAARVEPFGNIRTDKTTGQAVVEEVRKSNRTTDRTARLSFGMSGIKKEKDAPLAWTFDQVHLLQSDIVGFTKCVSRARPPCRGRGRPGAPDRLAPGRRVFAGR